VNRTWNEPFDGRRVLPAGLLTAVTATGANLGLREAGERWFDVPPDQPALSLVAAIAATLVGVFAACLVVAFLGSTQARPFTIFRRFAGIAFLVSCAGPLLGYAGWIPGMDPLSLSTMVLLLCMNTVTTVASIAFLPTMPRTRRPRRRF